MAASYHEKPGKVKPKFLCFPHFFALLFVQNVHTNPLQSGTPREAYPKQICAARESAGESSAPLPRNAVSHNRALKNLDFSCVPEYYSG
jgi:hypothetical protein